MVVPFSYAVAIEMHGWDYSSAVCRCQGLFQSVSVHVSVACHCWCPIGVLAVGLVQSSC